MNGASVVLSLLYYLQELIAFANDVEENLWFGWKESDLLKGECTIYCFNEHPKVRSASLLIAIYDANNHSIAGSASDKGRI